MGFSLDQKAKKIIFVINPPKERDGFNADDTSRLIDWLTENADIYAFIIHDLDVNDDGEPKRVHIHAYVECKQCKRIMTQLNSLAGALGFDTLAISAQSASNNPAGFFQYLIHKNNPEKHQYQASDIVSNLEKGEVQTMLEADSGNCSLERFIDVCRTAHTFADVLRSVGLETYGKYHRAIDQLWREACNRGRR